MKIYNLKDFTKGWFIGQFDPSILQTDNFEVAVKEYESGTIEDAHYHKEAVEFTIVLDGKIKMNGSEYGPNDIIEIERGESNVFESITDSRLLVIKTPSVKGDKYLL
jgi:quercetin dioxygenase-like cupin family protein